MGLMPTSSGFAHLTQVSHGPVRSAVGARSAQSQDSLCEDPEAAQPPQPSAGPRVSFAASGSEVSFAQEPGDEEEEEDDRETRSS